MAVDFRIGEGVMRLAAYPTRNSHVLLSEGGTMFEGLFQPTHLLVILVIGLFFFGPKKLPELGRGLAAGIRGFKDTFKSDSVDQDSPDAPR
jgi:sec-independent protein translocase protein TatA